MKVNILGTDYEILYQEKEENTKLEEANGLCETYSKKLIVEKVPDHPMNLEKVEEFQKKVLRHEIVHAFLHESGLDASSDWARNEEAVDWIALQAIKLMQTFKQAECT